MEEALIEAMQTFFSDNRVALMLVFFIGVLYWAFRSRFRR